ncbi:energy transducer TonB [Acidobacteriia bacterium AH_259_A11_L15]|nr:energy transducer TonB [Acidobacteriia bacterium AH_259_A11_L15]
MRRFFSLALVAFLALLLTLPAHSDERKEIERRLKAAYEGQLVRLEPGWEGADMRLDIPKEEAEAIHAESRIHLLIEKVKLKKNELELRARRIYFYQDIKGGVHRIKGPKRKYRLRWKDPQPSEAQLRQALDQAFAPLERRPEEWVDYSPPVMPPRPRRQPLSPQTGKEITPGIFTIGSDVTAPICVFCPDPEYPDVARRKKAKGIVVVWTMVTEKGRVTGIRVAKSAGRELDESAVVTISNWRFTPAIRQSKPVRVVMTVETKFDLY